MATDLQKMMMAKAQMNAEIQGEIRQTARDIFVSLVGPYLNRVVYETDPLYADRPREPSPTAIAELADLAMKAAPYLHQAAGMVQIDDAKQWEKVE
jgi:hypothetical protein